MGGLNRHWMIGGGCIALTLALMFAGVGESVQHSDVPPAAPKTKNADTAALSLANVRTNTESAGQLGALPGQAVQAKVLEKDFRPPSLAGTVEDGLLELNADGTLKRSLALRDRLDYWLTAIGELSPDEIRIRLVAEARALGGEAAAEDMQQLLDDYLAYLRAADEIPAVSPPNNRTTDAMLAALEATFERLQSLRVSYLGEETARAFFAEEEAYGRYTLDVLKAETDDSLSASEKLKARQQALANLPDPIRQRVQAQAEEEQKLEQGLKAMQSAGDAEALDRQLADIGYSEAQRKTAIRAWQQEKAFDAAYARYRAAVSQSISPGLSTPDQQAVLEQLRQAHFDSPQMREWARLRDLISRG